MAKSILMHYGTEQFGLDEEPQLHHTLGLIEEKLQAGGGWVDLPTSLGTVTICVSPGIPMWVRQVSGEAKERRAVIV